MHDNLYIFINKDINMFIIFLQIYNRRSGVVVERLPRIGGDQGSTLTAQ